MLISETILHLSIVQYVLRNSQWWKFYSISSQAQCLNIIKGGKVASCNALSKHLSVLRGHKEQILSSFFNTVCFDWSMLTSFFSASSWEQIIFILSVFLYMVCFLSFKLFFWILLGQPLFEAGFPNLLECFKWDLINIEPKYYVICFTTDRPIDIDIDRLERGRKRSLYVPSFTCNGMLLFPQIQFIICANLCRL